MDEKMEMWFSRLVVAATNPHLKLGAKPLDPRDIMFDWWGERKTTQPKTNEEWKALFRNFTLSKGGTVNGGSERRQPGNPHQRKRKAARDRTK